MVLTPAVQIDRHLNNKINNVHVMHLMCVIHLGRQYTQPYFD